MFTGMIHPTLNLTRIGMAFGNNLGKPNAINLQLWRWFLPLMYGNIGESWGVHIHGVNQVNPFMGWKLGPNDPWHLIEKNFTLLIWRCAHTLFLYTILLLRLVVGCILFVTLFFLRLAQFQRPGGPGPSFPIAKLYPHVIVSSPLFVWGPQRVRKVCMLKNNFKQNLFGNKWLRGFRHSTSL